MKLLEGRDDVTQESEWVFTKLLKQTAEATHSLAGKKKLENIKKLSIQIGCMMVSKWSLWDNQQEPKITTSAAQEIISVKTKTCCVI